MTSDASKNVPVAGMREAIPNALQDTIGKVTQSQYMSAKGGIKSLSFH